MPTLVCVPITVLEIDAALADANEAKLLGADIVELRIDSYFPGSEGDSEDQLRLNELKRLIAECPLPVILTCRSATEGGDYDGDEADRVSLLEKLCINTDHPPAYLDFELACYQKSANIRQKINLCVDHPKQERDVRTRLILSMHDFDGRPKDLMRRLSDAWAEPAASVVKFAFRARSIRDNLEIFEILRDAPKPTIGLGMGEFGLMSRVLAPKFGGFLTFASLRDEAATAPGQPTIADLLGMYRFRSIGKVTKLYGVIGWPVAHSMSPLIHNAGFEAVGHDGVYLPMPVPASDDVEANRISLRTTLDALLEYDSLCYRGSSVTIPFKEILASLVDQNGIGDGDYISKDLHDDAEFDPVRSWGTANTVAEWGYWCDERHQQWQSEGHNIANTDAVSLYGIIHEELAGRRMPKVAVIGAGGVSRSAAACALIQMADVYIINRNPHRAKSLAESLNNSRIKGQQGHAHAIGFAELSGKQCDLYINCTPVGMTGGPDPEGLSIPVHELAGKLSPDTVFFDTVYNPIETPMLRAAKEHGFRTIDGVEMFVRQAAAQFELWTGKGAPVQLFDRLVREKLGS
jgi:3-dehydroquinate dehydratase/shikimate dehydrogenase